ncbi:MAG TPA: DEAD/DEAH box helicase [Rhizomicrobium sp.]|nr:DEAD/DEAH box helicase [Rhizomicrobium sp.]
MTVSAFTTLGLSEPLLRALATENYTQPTPIQEKTIPLTLSGRDVLGIAQTGTGKTAAFGLPLLQRLAENRKPPMAKSARALILAPTRELAIQINDSLKIYGKHYNYRHAIVMGGVSAHGQIHQMHNGVDILVATPGRLLDLVKQKAIRLDQVSMLVVDEADRMLDMGFIRDVRRIVQSLPKARQSLLFSATMPEDVVHLAHEMLKDPTRIDVAPQTVTADRIEQQLYHIGAQDKRKLLVNLLEDPKMARVIVFTRTKHGANKVVEHLEKNGIPADAIHGNKSQNARVRAMDNFRSGRARLLVATDIAARGIDVDGITHVVNFELPNEPESYVHRIGRTARAGAEGIAISFCSPDERAYLRDIEKLVKRKLTVVGEEPAIVSHGKAPQPVRDYAKKTPFHKRKRNGGGKQGGGGKHGGGGNHSHHRNNGGNRRAA